MNKMKDFGKNTKTGKSGNSENENTDLLKKYRSKTLQNCGLFNSIKLTNKCQHLSRMI